MIEELNQIGNINSVNDFLDFKLSIKTIVLLVFLGGSAFIIFIIMIFGGVNNTVDYLTSIIETTKGAVNKNKKISKFNLNQNKGSYKRTESKEDTDDEDD